MPQHGGTSAAQQGCGISGGGAGAGSGGCARPSDSKSGAQLVKHEVGRQQAAQQRAEDSATASGQTRLRKKVPRIYFATRTHSQIAQVSGTTIAV